MSSSKAKVLRRFGMLAVRVAMVVVLAWCAGWVLNRSVETISERTSPAGFFHGMFHGAVMPCAMPGLLLGKELVIYAANNSGRIYNLGYTVGVNSCGALFFGMFYWRLHRWRRGKASGGKEPAS